MSTPECFLSINGGHIMFKSFRNTLFISLAAATLTLSPMVHADGKSQIEVTITNLTSGVYLTPVLVAAHKGNLKLFSAGESASDELTEIAESGNIAPMTTLLEANRRVSGTGHTEGLLAPGQSATVVINSSKQSNRISLASMMLPTNDGFIGLNSVRVPWYGSTTFQSPGYDAGTETNDELCVSIPGPQCGGEGLSLNDDGEGFIHINRGIHGIGDLVAADHDWRNPVAKITVKRVYSHKGY
jgi:hypothetical protein